MSSEDERYDLLIGFLEGELDDDERERVDEELASPGEAQDRLEAYRGLGAALAELEPPAPSAEARDRAYAAVLAAMAEDSAATPVEAPAETTAAGPSQAGPSQAGPSQALTGASAPSPAGAPRGQILRFLSAFAAAALIMVSAVFYLDGLEDPKVRMAQAPKKVAIERSAPVAGPKADAADLAQQGAAPEPESARFSEELLEAEAPKAAAPEGLSEDQARSELAQRVHDELKRERAALAKTMGKNMEGGADSDSALGKTAAAQAPAQPPALRQTPAPAPASPAREPEPELKTNDAGDRANDMRAAPADAPESGAEGAPSEGTRRGRKKKGPEGQRDAKHKETRAPRARRRMAGEPSPKRVQPEGDGTPRSALDQGQAGPDADSSARGGGGGGGAPGRSRGGRADDMQAEKGKPLAGRAGPSAGKPNDSSQRRDEEAEDGLREKGLREEGLQRFRRLRAPTESAPQIAKELQPAWIVTRGRERLLYVMEGSKLTQAPFPDLPLADGKQRAKAKQGAEPRVEPLQVTALAIQRRALATKRKSVDLRVLERREDLLAIAKLELASESKTGAQRDEFGRPGGPGSGAPADKGAPAGKKDAEPGLQETGKTGQQEPERPKDDDTEAETEEDSSKGQADKRPLPAPAAGRDRAELLLRLLGEIKAPRPSRSDLRRALRDAERRQVKARRR